ncbi:MAG: hypothetical protein KIT60_11735 [Burkholderiaceae bacterium]|nr:hypothetical protein [Burkholderiaceae bacterium]
MRRTRRAAIVCALLCAAAAVRAAEPFTKHNVVLLQSSAVLEARVASIDAMAEYIRAVEAAAREAVIAAGSTRPAAGFIVVAVQPGARSRVWLDFDAAPTFETGRQLMTRIGAVRPFEARNGPVVFALKVGLWDAFESKRVAPSPAAWKAAMHKAGKPLEIDELMELLWREPTAGQR